METSRKRLVSGDRRPSDAHYSSRNLVEFSVKFSGFGIHLGKVAPVVCRMIHYLEVGQFVAYHVVMQGRFEEEESPVEREDTLGGA
jgi:hypothetical protein